jgi:excisionase family DNA binding protein
MYLVNVNVPLASLTVGQFLEIIKNNAQSNKLEPETERINIQHVEQLTGLSRSMLYKLSAKNEIPHRKFGKRLVFMQSEIESWMESQTTPKLNRDQKAAKHLAELATRKHRRE